MTTSLFAEEDVRIKEEFEESTFRPAAVSRSLAGMDAGEEEGALMLRYGAGDVLAFQALYDRYKGPLYRYLKRQCRERAAADDLFQEVWGKVIGARARYEPRAKFATFLFHIAHNCTIDYFRKCERERGALSEEALESVAAAEMHRPDAEVATQQLDHALQIALAALPAEQRNVFLLYEESGLGLEEIGQITQVGTETAKSRLRYALVKLRQALADQREFTRSSR
jgi:RNA polymerase sigma-70 factor (ECF subfamily)